MLNRSFDALIVGLHDIVGKSEPDASAARTVIEHLCTAGVHVFIVCDVELKLADTVLLTGPAVPGRPHLCARSGSVVFEVSMRGPVCAWRRAAGDTPFDTTDAVRWLATWLEQRGITGNLVLVIGSQYGPVEGHPGRDATTLVRELDRAVVVSVGAEPDGVPAGVSHLGGGPLRLFEILDAQLARRRQRRVSSVDDDPTCIVHLPDEPAMDRVAETLGTLANGWGGTRGSWEEATESRYGARRPQDRAEHLSLDVHGSARYCWARKFDVVTLLTNRQILRLIHRVAWFIG